MAITPAVGLPPEAAAIVALALDRAPAAEPEVRGQLILTSMAGAMVKITGQLPHIGRRTARYRGRHTFALPGADSMPAKRGARFPCPPTDRPRIGGSRWWSRSPGWSAAAFLGRRRNGSCYPPSRCMDWGILTGPRSAWRNKPSTARKRQFSLYATDGEAKLAGIILLREGARSLALRPSIALDHDIHRSHERLTATGHPAPLPDVALAGIILWQAATVLAHRIEFQALAEDVAGSS